MGPFLAAALGFGLGYFYLKSSGSGLGGLLYKSVKYGRHHGTRWYVRAQNGSVRFFDYNTARKVAASLGRRAGVPVVRSDKVRRRARKGKPRGRRKGFRR